MGVIGFRIGLQEMGVIGYKIGYDPNSDAPHHPDLSLDHRRDRRVQRRMARDRKSTRLNSSHSSISYAVFFFNDTATTEIYTLSLHDALPILIQTQTLRITPTFLSIIAEIDEFKGAWRALGSLAPERLSALRRVATIESIGSSTRIEGSRLSDKEVQRLLSNLDIQTFSTRDEEEVAGYAQVIDTVFASWRDIDVTENHIRQLHRDLLRHSSKDQR